MHPPRLAPLRPEITVAPCDFNRNGRFGGPKAARAAPPGLSGVDDGKGGPYKAANWRRAEILPPMFFQEQFENTCKPRAAVVTFDRR